MGVGYFFTHQLQFCGLKMQTVLTFLVFESDANIMILSANSVFFNNPQTLTI